MYCEVPYLKPKQTNLLNKLAFSFPFRKQLGGKLGTSLQSELGVNTVGDLLQFSEEKLQERYGLNTGSFSVLE